MGFVSFSPAIALRNGTGLNPFSMGQAAPALSSAPLPEPPAEPPASVGEPSLDSALATLSADEAADFRNWGSQEKVLFLRGYQWLAVMTAPPLKRVDGSAFVGMLPQFADSAFAVLKAGEPYFQKLPADMAKSADEATSVVWNARIKTEAMGRDAAKKYKALRDRVVWELASGGATVEYEIVGDDPSNPGVIYARKIGADKNPDISAVFSNMAPKDLWDAGLSLQDKYDQAGVIFKRLDMSGTGRRMGAGPAGTLVVLIGGVVLVLGFFWLWQHLQEQTHLDNWLMDQISSDKNLSPADKADKQKWIQGTDGLWASVFGSGGFPWVPVIVGAAVIGVAFFLVPSLLSGGLSK